MKHKILLATNPDKTIGSIYELCQTENKIETKISRSPIDQGWINPGETVLSFLDYGNGIKINIDGTQIDLDYEAVSLLRFMLNRTFNPKTDETYKVYSLEEEK